MRKGSFFAIFMFLLAFCVAAISNSVYAVTTVPVPDMSTFAFDTSGLILLMGAAVTVLGGLFVYRKIVKSSNKS